jgi:hypothetical protein
MFQSLLYAVKRRILDEVTDAFNHHPAFSEKVKVYNKFPYDERVQYGVVMRNASASQVRLSADNYMSDLYSLVQVGRQTNYPGLAIEWVRENAGHVTDVVMDDVTDQLGEHQRVFKTTRPIAAGPDQTSYATDPGQVTVTVAGKPYRAEYVDGKTGVVSLYNCPGAGVPVTITYFARNAAQPGVYVIDFIEDNEFLVAPVYVIEKEVLIESTLGTETTAQLKNVGSFVDPNSDHLWLGYPQLSQKIRMIRGTDYSIDYTNGLITFLIPLQKHYQITADYRYQPLNYVNGPHTFSNYQEFHEIIPGVIISIGRRAQKGDRQVIVVTNTRERQAKIYGGHWEMSLELAVIAKDPMQMEEMADHVVSWLWSIRKNALEFEGITFNSVEPSGESEEVHIETTGDMYYETSVSVNVMSEWQNFIPYLTTLTIGSIVLEPDIRPVLKGPIIGFERLTAAS